MPQPLKLFKGACSIFLEPAATLDFPTAEVVASNVFEEARRSFPDPGTGGAAQSGRPAGIQAPSRARSQKPYLPLLRSSPSFRLAPSLLFACVEERHQ